MIVNIHHAKTNLSQLVAKVEEHKEEIIIGRNNKPIAKIVPYDKPQEKRTPGKLKGKLWISPDFQRTDDEILDLFN